MGAKKNTTFMGENFSQDFIFVQDTIGLSKDRNGCHKFTMLKNKLIYKWATKGNSKYESSNGSRPSLNIFTRQRGS